MLSVFFSYSHHDQAARDELETHLSLLKRQHLIGAWHDGRIPPGDELDPAISAKLESADLILLLVSPHFIASTYCYDREMARAMERHERREARVMPVILRPCDWHSAPFGKLKALPRDGKPVAKYPNPDDAYLEIVQAIRAEAEVRAGIAAKAVAATPGAPTPVTAAVPAAVTPRSSNLRVKRAFTDHDRDTFLEESFAYVAKFFEGSLAELEARHPGVSGRFRQLNTSHFSAAVYRQGKCVSKCGIRLGAGLSANQIIYSNDPESVNSMNEAVRVADDGYTLFLKATGFSMRAPGHNRERLSAEGAAELFWGMLISPLQ